MQKEDTGEGIHLLQKISNVLPQSKENSEELAIQNSSETSKENLLEIVVEASNQSKANDQDFSNLSPFKISKEKESKILSQDQKFPKAVLETDQSFKSFLIASSQYLNDQKSYFIV